MKRRLVLISVAVLAGTASMVWAATQPKKALDGAKAFERMKSLVGRWEATTADGKKAISSYELASNDSALLERFYVEGAGEQDKENMVTMYHLDGGNLMLTHYCAAKNQPRMRAVSYSPETETLKFAFLDATNLSSPNDGHMHRAVFKFVDGNHFTSEWTFRKDQKDAHTEVLQYTRKP